MLVRVTTGLVMAAIVLSAVLAGPYEILAGLLSAVVLGAQWEFLGLRGAAGKRADRVVAVIGGAAVLAAVGFAPAALPLLLAAKVLAAVVIALLLLVLFTPHPIAEAGPRAAHVLASVVYVAFLGALALAIVRDHGQAGRIVLLAAAAATWMNDSAAFFGGKFLGRHKMYPAVSPNKTWEGSVAGMLGSVAGVFLVRYLLWDVVSIPDATALAGTPVCACVFEPAWLLGFALVGGASGQVGDLAESLFKRSYGVKDSGTIIPGHGGLLDRIDAFLFVAPVAYLWFFG